MLLNLSNHPSTNWPESQKKAAIETFGSIEDLPFPQIDPNWDEDKIDELAAEYLLKIMQINPAAVHIMGELTFAFKLVDRLKAENIKCVASTTVREASEENGIKISVFRFIRFREY